jgi:trans-aconitate 2-methyltransferase
VGVKPKQWDTELYESRLSFVWTLGAELIDLLKPVAGETIVDLGCGTGQLTVRIAESGCQTIGIDSDPAMLAQARMNYPKLTFQLADARSFALDSPADAVFSNAALHWVRDADEAVARVWAALRPGGRFVAEFGSRGNIAQILAATLDAVPAASNPWYFPSLGQYAALLEQHGFRVTHGFEIDRETPLEGESGMAHWLEMFGDAMLSSVPAGSRTAAIARIVERLRPVLYRDGCWRADYKRLRVRAVKGN